MTTCKLRIPRITPGRYAVLKMLRAPDGASMADIAHHLGFTRANAHSQLLRAAEDGLAATNGEHRGWRLTARGSALLDALEHLPE